MAYELTLTREEHKALAWIADRYESARIIYDGMTIADHDDTEQWGEWGGTFTIPEHVVWEYVNSLPEENGDDTAILPPCAGGPLADKLVRLYESVV